MKYKLICSCLFLGIVSGCASSRTPVMAEISPVNRIIDGEIARSAELIHHDLRQLQRIREANSPGWKTYPTPKTGPLSRKITLRFTGPAHELVDVVAQLVGYGFTMKGIAPTPPKIVQIDVVDAVAFRVLEDVGLQLGRSAGISIDEDHQTVMVQYGK